MSEREDVRFLQGDALAVLQTLPSESVHCCITSPPYYSLRCYGVEGQIGLEETPEAHIEKLVAVFGEVRRVLRRDGVFICNYGDCYAGDKKGNTNGGPSSGLRNDGRPEKSRQKSNAHQQQQMAAMDFRKRTPAYLKPKDLVGMPFRLALALQADGWWWRSCMPWLKRSALPESVTDRPSTALEYVMLFAKSGSRTFWVHRDLPGTRTQPAPDYRWVNEAGEERREPPADREGWQRVNLWTGRDYFWDADAVRRPQAEGTFFRFGNGKAPRKVAGPRYEAAGQDVHTGDASGSVGVLGNGRNLRNSDFYFDSLDLCIEQARAELAHLERLRERGGLLLSEAGEPLAFDVNTEACKENHFASFPTKLVRPLIQAGTSEYGVCAACGAPWVRVTEKELVATRGKVGQHRGEGPRVDMMDAGSSWNHSGGVYGHHKVQTLGWRKSCRCETDETQPAVVLDPFAGTGTVAIAANKLGRRAILIDLKADYIRLSEKRNAQVSLLL